VSIFEELVVVEDSRVFWNQSRGSLGLLLNIALIDMVVEEFIGDRRSGLVLIPEGRTGKGWEMFGSELRLALEHFRVGFRDVLLEKGVQAGRNSRRSYAEVLAKTVPPLEDSFGCVSGPVARVPRWVRESSARGYPDKDGSALALSKWRALVPVKSSLVPTIADKAPGKQSPANPAVSFCGHVASAKHFVKGRGASNSSTLFGANLELGSLKETLVKLKEESRLLGEAGIECVIPTSHYPTSIPYQDTLGVGPTCMSPTPYVSWCRIDAE
jgi:hypothetical protein